MVYEYEYSVFLDGQLVLHWLLTSVINFLVHVLIYTQVLLLGTPPTKLAVWRRFNLILKPLKLQQMISQVKTNLDRVDLELFIRYGMNYGITLKRISKFDGRISYFSG